MFKERQCYGCNSRHSYIPSNKKTETWYLNRDISTKVIIGFLCSQCYFRYISNPRWNPINHPRWNPITNPKRLNFTATGKRIYIKELTRKGVCELCGAKIGVDCQRTALHHVDDMYDESDPLKNTLEVCTSCHTKETLRLEKKSGYNRYLKHDIKVEAVAA